MEQLNNSKLGKEYDKAIYCHLAYLTYAPSISSEMPVLMNHELESRLLGETSTISDIQMELKNLFSEEKLKNLLMRVKEVNE